MHHHASPTRRELLRSAKRLFAAGGAGVAVLAVSRTGFGPLVGAPGGGVSPTDMPAKALFEAERVGRRGSIAFPLAGFDVGEIVCLNNYGMCRRQHEGVDIGELRQLSPRVPLVACVDGVVTQVDNDPFDRSGRFVVIRGDDQRWYRYHHLDEIAGGLVVDDRLSVGEQIGTMGDTGNTMWPHLHFEVWVGNGAYRGAGVSLDPVPLLTIPPQSRCASPSVAVDRRLISSGTCGQDFKKMTPWIRSVIKT